MRYQLWLNAFIECFKAFEEEMKDKSFDKTLFHCKNNPVSKVLRVDLFHVSQINYYLIQNLCRVDLPNENEIQSPESSLVNRWSTADTKDEGIRTSFIYQYGHVKSQPFFLHA